MQVLGKAKKVTIYIDESDKWKHKPLHTAILDRLKAEDCAGATITRAVAGFGAHSRIHTAGMVALSANLPLIIEWVDSPSRVERVMPQLRPMVSEGLITIQDVEVIFYSHRNLRQLPASLHVHDIMSREVNFIQSDAQLLEAIEMLLDKIFRALPVVDTEQHVIGIVTEGDLLRKLDTLATSAQQHLTRPEITAILTRLQRIDQAVDTVMTPNPITITSDTFVTEALNLMIENDIKRLPVVDTENKLVGMVSRVDVLRTMSPPLVAEGPRQNLTPGHYVLVKEVMLTNTATVQASAPIAEVISLLVSNVQRRVVVVDAQQRVVGLITDGDLIKRARPAERPGIIQSLNRHTPLKKDLGNRTAEQVMTTPVITVTPETSLLEALHLLLQHQIKRLPVVNHRQKLVGLVGRGGILQALGKTSKLNVPG